MIINSIFFGLLEAAFAYFIRDSQLIKVWYKLQNVQAQYLRSQKLEKCVTEPHYNEILLCCSDVLAYKSYSPDARKHLLCKKDWYAKRIIPNKHESYCNCNIVNLCMPFYFFFHKITLKYRWTQSNKHLLGLFIQVLYRWI